VLTRDAVGVHASRHHQYGHHGETGKHGASWAPVTLGVNGALPPPAGAESEETDEDGDSQVHGA
jgi:hypothetical protein